LLKEEYQSLQTTKDLLGCVSLSPSKASVDFILAYDALYETTETKAS